MGVKYLQTYAVKNCSEYIQLETEIENFRKSKNIQKPLIVFDFTACITIFIQSKWEILHGTRQQEFCNRVDDFLSRLIKLNTKLVFFLEGPIKLDKYSTWVERRNDKYNNMKTIFQQIKSGRPLNNYATKKLVRLVSTLYDNFEIIAKKYGDIINSLDYECDLQLAKYAIDNDALAVLAGDSDFLIMPGNWDIWLIDNLSIFNMTAKKLVKSRLRDSLNLKPEQMPIFATLCGNDFVPKHFLKNFENSIGLGGSVDFQVISNYVRKHFDNINSNIITINKIKDLVDPQLVDRYNKIKISLNSYSYDLYSEQKIEPIWLKNYCTKTNFSFVYQIIKEMPFNISHDMLDLSLANIKTFQELVLPIVKRAMGIVLYENRHDSNIKREIYLKRDHQTDYQNVSVSPDYPTFDIPHISHILDVAENGDRVSKEIKLDILCWIISPEPKNLSRNSIEHILDKKFFIPLLILNYLVKEGQFTEKEADAVFFTIYKVIHLDPSENKSIRTPKTISSRSCFVTFTYTYMVYYLYIALIVSGLPEYVLQGYFDGYIFNDIFFNWDSIKLESMKKEVKDFRLYAN